MLARCRVGVSWTDDGNGKTVDEAGPAIPVEIQGLSDIPHNAGEDVIVLGDERRLAGLALFRRASSATSHGEAHAANSRTFSRAWVTKWQRDARADRQGRRPGLRSGPGLAHGARQAARPARSQGNIVHAAVGGITESDVNLALASKAVTWVSTRADGRRGEARREQRRRHPLLRHHLRGRRRDPVGPAGMLAPEKKESMLGM